MNTEPASSPGRGQTNVSARYPSRPKSVKHVLEPLFGFFPCIQNISSVLVDRPLFSKKAAHRPYFRDSIHGMILRGA